MLDLSRLGKRDVDKELKLNHHVREKLISRLVTGEQMLGISPRTPSSVFMDYDGISIRAISIDKGRVELEFGFTDEYGTTLAWFRQSLNEGSSMGVVSNEAVDMSGKVSVRLV